ncbi:MAG: hypothetical protein ACPLSM_00190 [Thermosphaera sp.]
MSSARTEPVLRFGGRLINIINSLVIVLTSIILLVTLGLIAKDTYYLVCNFNQLDFTYIQSMANEVVFLFVYIEIIRSAIVAKRHPEMYIVALAEVGFIVTIRDVIRSSIIGNEEGIILTSLSVLVFAAILLLMYKYIMPSRVPPGSE